MSLGQLTANYTDSEGEDGETYIDEDESHSRSSPIAHRVSELKESDRGTPTSVNSIGSGTNTPKKKAVNRLVSYANEDEDDDDGNIKEDAEEPDVVLNAEPMDIGTDEGEDDIVEAANAKGLDDSKVKLPPLPPGKCSKPLQDKINKMLNERRRGKDWNVYLQNRKDFRNPSIYEKLIDLIELDEFGSNYPLDLFDPHCWGPESFYEELARVQKEEMDKREKERKSKVDIIAGLKKNLPEDDAAAKKRKSRFDQGVPAPLLKSMAVPLASSTSGTKIAIDAFGGLKKLAK